LCQTSWFAVTTFGDSSSCCSVEAEEGAVAQVTARLHRPVTLRREKPVDNDEDFDRLVIRVVDAFGEAALGAALVRALEDLPYQPLDASLWHLLPASSRKRAIMVDGHVLATRFAEQLRRLVKPH
jgi:hypothetical protein